MVSKPAVAVSAVALAACAIVAGTQMQHSSAGTVPTAPVAAVATPTPHTSSSPVIKKAPTYKPDAVLAPRRNGVTVNFRVTTHHPVFFLTIDDGWSHQQAAADYVTGHHIPVTVFLTKAAVGGDWNFFRRMAAFDAVQNHTMTHDALSLPKTNREYQICDAQKIYQQKFGVRPWILRPPFGAGFMPRRSTTPLIETTAASCRITRIVLWNVTVSKQGKIAFAGTPYRAGDIVLLHFEGDLKANLTKVIAAYAHHGLSPASLSAYLPR